MDFFGPVSDMFRFYASFFVLRRVSQTATSGALAPVREILPVQSPDAAIEVPQAQRLSVGTGIGSLFLIVEKGRAGNSVQSR